MEKVWAELKKIEAQAETIRAQAEVKSKEIAKTSEADAEKLLADANTFVQEDAQTLRTQAINEATISREQKLKAHQEAANALRRKAMPRMDEAANIVVDAVLGKTKDASGHEIR